MRYCKSCHRPLKDTNPYTVLCEACLRGERKSHGKHVDSDVDTPVSLLLAALQGTTPPKEQAWKKRLHR